MAPSLFGLLGAGLIMDNISPFAVWYIAGVLGLIAGVAFIGLHYMTKQRFATLDLKQEVNIEEPASKSPENEVVTHA